MAKRLSKKWANYRRRYHYLRRTVEPPNGPLYLNVEPTNACNLKCYHCSIDGSRKRGMMDLELFRRVIDQAWDAGVYEVALFLGGEPLLHKRLPEMISYVHDKGLESRVYTNACLLTRERSEEILDAGLDFLGVSIDGDNREEYEAMRVGADFDEVVANIMAFLELKKERGQDRPYVSFQMIKLKENPRQFIDPAFIARFDGLPVDEFSFRNPHDWRGEKEGEISVDTGERYYPCQVFWSAMSVAWDGRVVGCSADLNGRQIFGDLSRETIMDVWNGEEMKRHRRLLKERRYEELPLCASCHALWYNGKDMRLSLLSQLPPFEQLRAFVYRLNPKKWRQERESRSPGAIRSRKQPD
ncbi:MAG: radical SAM protein [Gaiellales bacterium]|nr:MAG: radical SAM protein [Gaiellales bacterium]